MWPALDFHLAESRAAGGRASRVGAGEEKWMGGRMWLDRSERRELAAGGRRRSESWRWRISDSRIRRWGVLGAGRRVG